MYIQFRYSLFSDTMGFPVDCLVCIPEGKIGDGDIPCLWLTHGANGECEEFLRDSRILAYAEADGLALISVSCHNGFYVDMEYGADYGTFLANEWIDKTRCLFPCLSCSRSKNYIAGASMGGYGAVKLGLVRSDIFSCVGAFAGSIEMATIFERNSRGIQPGGADFIWAFGSYERLVNNENDPIYMAGVEAKKGTAPDFMLICGKDDFGYALNTIARDDLTAKGCNVEFVECEGVHSMDCWDSQIPVFLDWLMEKMEKMEVTQ